MPLPTITSFIFFIQGSPVSPSSSKPNASRVAVHQLGFALFAGKFLANWSLTPLAFRPITSLSRRKYEF
jgi:hypothetical protein